MPESSTENKEPIAELEEVKPLESEEAGGTEHEEIHEGAETNEAGSPAAQDDKQPEDIESAVRRALKITGKEQSSGSADSEGKANEAAADGTKKPEEEEGKLGEITDAEMATYKTKTQHRMKDFQRKLADSRVEIEKYKPSHDKLAAFDEFCQSKGLSADDVSGLLNIGVAAKENPAKALELLSPIVYSLRTIVGENLPADLQKEIADGKITETRAKEISKLRAGNFVTEYNKKETVKRDESQAVAKLAKNAEDAVNNWEAQQQKTDPDYRIKSARVAEAIELAMVKAKQAGTLPKTVEEAVKLCDDVKKRVDGEYAKIIPKKVAVASIPSGSGASTGSKPAAPKSYMDAVNQALGH